MAAYYHGGAGTDIQASTDGLQTLYLMNPSFAGYADAGGASPPGPTNMMLLNSAVSTMTPASFAHHHQQSPSAAAAQQHFVGIPLQAPPSGYNLWAPATTSGAAADMSSPQAHTPGGGTGGVSAVLSLSSREAPPPVTVAAVGGGADEGKYHLVGPSATSQGQMVMSSKYLKAAQELLDEVVSVSKGVEDAAKAKSLSAVKKKEDSEGVSGGGTTEDGGGGAKSGGAAAPELSTAERQELQMKKSKLINMLDEVEQRYRQYHGQMQAVSSSFEAAAGAGSARTYTALALRTISRQFRCLRDAIAGQVRAASRALGEDADAAVAAAGGGRTVGSRLRYIDHQLRQQRALQQLGMMQGGAWRPQRGLPERSVSILRAWLFEHFLHPYPKDSDKIMLAKQTGLTRSQVSNWFINARVRLWKPMVEEMYLEETKDQDGGAGNDDGKSGGVTKSGDTSNGADGVITPRSTNGGAAMSKQAVEGASSAKQGVAAGVHHHGSTLLELAGDHHTAHAAGFYQDDGDEDDDDVERRLKKARGDDTPAAAAFHGHHHVHDMAALHAQAAAAARQQHEEVSHRELLMKFMESGGGGGGRDHQQDAGGAYSFFAPGPYGQFGSEPFAFSGNGGVSLTLGLPHGAGGGGGAAEQTASFLMGSSAAGDSASHGGAGGYDMNMQSTKSFAAQLMRDFVA
ncbi:unnamed protein product [Urochloa decumbens]|uniref:Homeobox domain-containing protein n=1 Tax=Urochloa decumbens TaxID=240449 RepID=A0ABC9H7L8_9POAL